ncbi:MAG: ABC transporter ATP-binding protein/permease [Rhodospirillaceae bacterium]|nr:ABC transporter ATP-binding protein/permease [Rhodospirillaceae bacterium]
MPDDASTRPNGAPPAAELIPLPLRVDHPVGTVTPFALIWDQVRRNGGARMWIIVGLALIGALIDTMQPYILGALVNALNAVSQLVMNGDAAAATSSAAREAFPWFAALCAVWVVGPVLARIHTLAAMTKMLAFRTHIQDELFAYMHGHSPGFFLDNMSGALSSKVRNAAGAATAVTDYIFSTLPRLTVLFVVSAILVAQQAPQFLLLFGAFAAVFTLVAGVMAQGCRKYAKANSVASTAYTGRFVDSLNNWDLVRSFARQTLEQLTLEPLARQEYDTGVQLRLVLFRMRIALHAVGVAFLIVVVWWAFHETVAGRISVGTFTMLMSLSLLISAHVNTLGDNLLQFFEHLGVLTDSLETVTRPHEIVDPPDAVPLKVGGGGIEVRDLTFGYSDGTPVFSGLNLTIAPGEKVGLVGSSGAGKSTLLRLLRRQFRLQDGAIFVDGQDITKVTWDSLHEHFAEVAQSPSVFHRSVRDNIIYGRPAATEAEMIAAAKLAHCHEFIAARKGGYDAIVGEKGMKLSGGERQRVAIARAFIKNAPILILDEATSSLDSEAEHLIQDGLLKLMKGRTVIAVAHRLSTIMHLDRIIVLEQGRIVEEGAHAALLALGGTYARLWNRQAGGFI